MRGRSGGLRDKVLRRTRGQRGPIDTSSTGTKSFTVNAEDNVGTKTSHTHTYEVRSSLPPVAKDDSYSTDEDQRLTKPPPASWPTTPTPRVIRSRR